MSNYSKPLLGKLFSWRLFFWIGCGLCSAPILFNIYVCIYQESWIFEPDVNPTGYQPKNNLIPTSEGGLSPAGKLLSPPNETWSLHEVVIHFQKFSATTMPAKGVLLYFHGNRGDMKRCRWEIEPFLLAGYDVWTMDYRTFGESKGPLNETALVNDARMFYKYLRDKEGVKEEDLIVWGRSFGSGIAASVAANNSPRLLVLETPYCSFPDAATRRNPFVLPIVFRYRLPTYDYLDYISCRVHLIHGDSDEKIPYESSEAIAKRCTQLGVDVEPHLISGGNHNLRGEEEFDVVLMKILE
jgi:alpha-beta hydrolase superfamily lysophospholipase